MTKSESKYFNTARIMDEALIALLGKKDIRYISVKEICKMAGVNISTFYLHYETIDDLLTETINYIQDEFNCSYSVSAEEFTGKIQDAPLQDLVLINQSFLESYLTFIKEHKTIYKAYFYNSKTLQGDVHMSSMYKNILKPIFCRFGIPENDQKYWLVYHINGVTAIIKEWLKYNCTESIDELIQIIEDCVRVSNGAVGGKYGESKR